MSTFESVACPYCGKLMKPLSSSRPPLTDWDIDPLDYRILVVKESAGAGPGRGNRTKGVGGFKVREDLSLNIRQLMEQRPEIADAIRMRFIAIVKRYIKAGIISRSDLR